MKRFLFSVALFLAGVTAGAQPKPQLLPAQPSQWQPQPTTAALQAAPAHAPQATPQAAPAPAPKAAPQALPAHAPQATPSHAPQATPQAAPAHAPQAAPQATPAHAPQAAPQAPPAQAPQGRPAAFDRILADPAYAYLEYRGYPVPTERNAAPPRGYKPVYISHYGRHGARFYYIQEGYDQLKAFFVDALAAGVLTEKGKALAQKYLAAYPYFDLHAGDLTRKGWEQHWGIGERMYRNYREVFRKRPHVDARASTIQRSIMSMVSCCDALETADRRIRIDKETSESFMSIMNPVHSTLPFAAIVSKRPYSAQWKREVKALQDRVIPSAGYMKTYFTDTDWLEAHYGANKLAQDLYAIMVSTSCTEVPADFSDLFTTEELLGLWEWRNFLYYNLWGPGERGINPARYIVADLLEDILDKAEEDLAGPQGGAGQGSGAGEGSEIGREGGAGHGSGVGMGSSAGQGSEIGRGSVTGDRIGARLRFGHDTPIGMLLYLMGVEGWNKAVAHPDEVKMIFDYSNVPMAANLQWVFYQNRKGETLVRMMLNERDLRLPLPDSLAPYYRWDDFLAHYRAVAKQAKAKQAEILAERAKAE